MRLTCFWAASNDPFERTLHQTTYRRPQYDTLTMSSTEEEDFGRSDLSAIVIENPHSADECVLYPSDATEEELKTVWIRAEGGDYTPLASML